MPNDLNMNVRQISAKGNYRKMVIYKKKFNPLYASWKWSHDIDMAMNLAADKVAFTTLFRNPLQVLRSPASYWEFTKDEYFLPFRENSLESFVIYNET